MITFHKMERKGLFLGRCHLPKKRNIYRSYGEKLITLFVRLLFSGESYSLTELADMLQCSKQTVLRLVEDIRMAYKVNLEETKKGNRKYYRIKRPERKSITHSLTELELNILEMCRDFTAHLLGDKLFEEATHALLKSEMLLSGKAEGSKKFFASFRPGTIDYTPHHDTICAIIESMKSCKVCKIRYQAIMKTKPTTFYIKPLKLFSHDDTIYLHAQMAKYPGKKYHEPRYDPLLAVHRIKKIEISERCYEFPERFDFEKSFNHTFGIIKEDDFEVEIEFTGWAARFAAERVWSANQKISKKKKGKTYIVFSASSEPEVMGKLLYFGDEAKLIRPEWLVEKVADKVKKINALYSSD